MSFIQEPKNINQNFNQNLNLTPSLNLANNPSTNSRITYSISSYQPNLTLTQNSKKKYDEKYFHSKYAEIKTENIQLKQKLFDVENYYKNEKTDKEEKLLQLRDENANLQLQLQKMMETQKNLYLNNESYHNQNKVLLSDISTLKNEKNNFIEALKNKDYEINNKNQQIDELIKDKNMLLNQQTVFQSQINILNKDKEILLKQIVDLNDLIDNKISLKLKQNDENLKSLLENIEKLKEDNKKYKSDNKILFNENKKQKNLIELLTTQNQKLINDNKVNENIIKNNKNNKINQELFEEKLNILNNNKNKKSLVNNENINNFENYINEGKNNNSYSSIIGNMEPLKNNILNNNVNNSINKINNNINYSEKKRLNNKHINYKRLNEIKLQTTSDDTCRSENRSTVSGNINTKNRDNYLNNGIRQFPHNNQNVYNSNPNIRLKIIPSNENINENLHKTDSVQNRNINFLNNFIEENNIPIKKDIYNMNECSECNSDEINELNTQTYAKSMLSEYVEDLDVIQYKDDNKYNI